MKILLVNTQFETGGASRVASVMCQGFVARGVDLIVVSDITNAKIDYDLPSSLRLCPLYKETGHSQLNSKAAKFFEAIKNIRHYIKEYNPDVIIAVEAYAYFRVFIAKLFLKYKVIAADHTSFNRHISKLVDFTRFHLYKFADGLSILTEKDKLILGNRFPQKEVIYNPLSFPILEKSETSRRNNILCAGRLDMWHIKGFDIILDIWKELSTTYSDWVLEIAGTGDQESINRIESMIKERNLDNRVHMLGQVHNMAGLFSETSIFALPSRVEGFPMVLMEALSQGCPSVAFALEGATSEMVETGAGVIVEDGNIAMFKQSLTTLLDDKNMRDEMSAKAVSSVKRFSQENFTDHWMSYINKVIGTCR